MATEAPKKTRRARTNYQKLVEQTLMFCRVSIETCELFRSEAGDGQMTTTYAMDAQIRAYQRVIKLLGGEAQ